MCGLIGLVATSRPLGPWFPEAILSAATAAPTPPHAGCRTCPALARSSHSCAGDPNLPRRARLHPTQILDLSEAAA